VAGRCDRGWKFMTGLALGVGWSSRCRGSRDDRSL